MRLRLVLSIALALAGALSLLGSAVAQGPASGEARVIELDGAIDPAAADYLTGALDDAADDDVQLAIIRLDTPGGLLDSTREMTDAITAAPFPVAVHVAPEGARAASAGLFVTQAADIAAMAPQTNIGAATPIDSDGSDIDDSTLGEKITNDAAAYVSALAKSHERNGDLAASMVTDAVAVDFDAALSERLIDVVATDTDELLAELDGFEVAGPKATTLDTDGLEVSEVSPSFTQDLLGVLLDPTVSFLLLLVGFVGIAIELFAPGAILPGAIGVAGLIGGLFGTLQLPVTAIGIVLLLAGAGLIIAEAHVASGVIGIVGVVCLALAGAFLYDTGSDAVAVSLPVVIAIAVVLGGLVALAGRKALASRREPVHTGYEELAGAIGRVREPLDPKGFVFVSGALWRATSAEGLDEAEVAALRERDSRVTVLAVDGLTLRVVPGEREVSHEGAATSPTGRSRPAGTEPPI